MEADASNPMNEYAMYATGSRNGPNSQPAPCPVPPVLKIIDSGLIRWKISR
jgi:hypothetical protein